MGLFGAITASQWNLKGAALVKKQRYNEAISCYDRAIAIDPKYNYAWYNKGAALKALGKYEEAISCYDRAIAIDSKDADSWNGKGLAFYEQKRYEEAISCYDRAIAIDPKHVNSWNNKGLAFYEQKRYEEAISCYDRAIAIDPKYIKATNNRKIASEALEKQRKENSIKKAEKLKKLGKFLEAADIYRELGETDTATVMEELDKKLRRANGYEKALNYQKAAELYEELEMWEDARRCREQMKVSKGVVRHIDLPEEQEKMDVTGISDFFSYTIGRKIGKGGFSKVYAVSDADGNEFAVKIPLDVDFKEQETLALPEKVLDGFIREARIWNTLTEKKIPNIVPLYGFGVRPFPWFAMELCDESLADRMKKMDFKEKIEVLGKILNTLNEIHYLGMVHRDIKPQNILFKDNEPLLTDFGLGKALNKASKSSQGYSGTLDYSSPEQFNKKLGGSDRRTDIWQVGVLAYEMFTGRLPFEREDITEVMFAVLNETPEHPSDVKGDVPRELGDAIMKALEKRKEERWQSAADFKRALEEVGI